MSGRLWIVVAVVLVPLLAYPLATLAGGEPRWPSRAECVHRVVEGRPVAVVFGRVDDPLAADELRDRVLAVGFKGTKAVADGCGRWKVVLDGVPTVTVGRGILAEAQTVRLRPTLELDSGS